MDPQRWQRLKSILSDAFDEESTSARLAFVERACSDDEALLRDAESLLAEGELLRRSATDDLEACAENAATRIRREGVSQIGKRIGAYVVTHEIGRGGMGTVYLAARADGYFEKEVAIKLLNAGVATEEMVRQFHSERKVLARLDHPNIARLLDAGTTDDGFQYFVMDYVVGMPVTHFLDRRDASIASRLELFLKICAAVEFAHAHSVVHRDLKASNILVTAKGEVKLLDFGIAKMLLGTNDRQESSTPGRELLTPISASPEQAKGEAVTQSTDVYALGALLYEMLSGRRPHRFPNGNPTLEELLAVLCEQETYPPSDVVKAPARQRQLRGDLDAILLCALQKDPARRYASVKDFADDVQRHLAGRPIHVRSGDLTYVLRRTLSKSPAVLFALAALIVASGLSLMFFSNRSLLSRNAALLSKGSERAEATPPKKSIAVLPFAHLSGDSVFMVSKSLGVNGAEAYFADGIHDDILEGLSRVSDLKVISRNSVASYGAGTASRREIARILNVAYLLEGTVQKAGEHLLINVRLVEAETESKVWEERYEKNLADLFPLESEIVRMIATRTNATLSPEKVTLLAEGPTRDLETYELFLRAREALGKRDYPRAIDLLRSTLERDPQFVLAYCLLSKAYLDSYRFSQRSEESLAAGKDAAETAMRLAPNLPDAHLTMARYYRASMRFDRMLEELSGISIPRDKAEFYYLLAVAERCCGRWKYALRDAQTAVGLDPRNYFACIDLLQIHIALRQYKEAEEFADRAISQSLPDNDVLPIYRSYCRLGLGNLEGARSILENAPVHTIWGTDRLIQLAIFARDLDRASALIATLPAERKYSWVWEGIVATMRGEEERARQYYIGAAEHYREVLANTPNDLEAIAGLSFACVALGQTVEGVSQAQHAVELASLSGNAIDGPGLMLLLAEIYLRIGEREAAFELLAKVVELPLGPDYGTLKFDPVWDGIRGEPKFQKIMARAAQPPNWN